ncbi:Rha family transcriptional regulator [Leuconostoc gelidum subsp. gasicomitatum]|uniref:Rha family transcriptional regulator n=1 Tax=Leuconostoc gasicomitatum TaxID=115778 RepID=UPI001CC706D0|nr:Rha family transcriptional regulator [Leuconostoc gasicomitatum]MBZ5983626.1 Rha family transcriptional regulator [Leuconostoc gasicomitatum]
MELVYYKGLQDEPYTTAEIIAEYTDNKYQSVSDAIRKNESDLKDFGVVRFEIAKPNQGSNGGRPRKIYHLNEQQATFLITLLDNTPKVKAFKKLLVKSFYQIKSELDERKIHRQVNKVMNIGFGDVIKEHYPESKHVYSNFHNLAYKYALGVTPKQIKEQRHTDDPQSALTSDESSRLERAKQQISLFIQDGYDYEDIKAKMFADI